jgi:hypothetical protein
VSAARSFVQATREVSRCRQIIGAPGRGTTLRRADSRGPQSGRDREHLHPRTHGRDGARVRHAPGRADVRGRFPTGGEKSPLAGGFEPGTAHRDRLAERRPHSDAGRPHGGGPASADGSPTEVTPLFASVSSASLYDAGRAREQTRLVVEESGHGSPLTLPRRGELRLKTAAPRRAATFAFELGKLGDACATAACASRCLASTSTTRRWAASRSDTSSVRRSATGA